MQRTLVIKLLAIAAVAFVLLIALLMIQGVVAERQARQRGVESEIASSFGHEQLIVGPLLVVPYTQSVTKKQWNERSKRDEFVNDAQLHTLLLPPERLEVAATVDTEQRYRGVYSAQTFALNGTWRGSFRVPRAFGRNVDVRDVTLGEPYLAFGIADARGIRGKPEIVVDGKALTAQGGTRLAGMPQGFHAPLALALPNETYQVPFDIELAVAGTAALAFAPIGESSTVTLNSPWPHPSFEGRFLPVEKRISAEGFSATWRTTALATNLNEHMSALLGGPAPAPEQAAPRYPAGSAAPVAWSAYGVRFVEPINRYLQAERAVKYGILFLGLVFASFFLFEVLRNPRIHPLQYGLVGLSIAIFFLLLLSLSERIAFAWAYVAGAGACTLLNVYYLAHVLGSVKRALIFGVQLAALFAALYGLLLSEDNALLLGSVLLFVCLAVVMVATRRVDWYRLGERTPDAQRTS